MKSNSVARLVSSALCAVPLVAFAGPASEPVMTTPPPASPWEFRIEPYAWLTAIDGTNGPAANPATINASFSDIFDVLEMAAALQFEVKNGRWGLIGDAFYAKLGTSGNSPGPEDVQYDVGFKQFLGELEVFYRIVDCPEQGFLDAYAGLRYNSLSLDLDTDRVGLLREEERHISADKDWADPIVGLRGQWNLNDRWYLAGKGDIGGFGVSSDFTWNLQATVGYNFTDRVSAEVGYRYFDTDYSDGGFVYDIAQSGIVLGGNIKF
jgi:opacity protein-like surface antigen